MPDNKFDESLKEHLAEAVLTTERMLRWSSDLRHELAELNARVDMLQLVLVTMGKALKSLGITEEQIAKFNRESFEENCDCKKECKNKNDQLIKSFCSEGPENDGERMLH